jgi:hypothetical protein
LTQTGKSARDSTGRLCVLAESKNTKRLGRHVPSTNACFLRAATGQLNGIDCKEILIAVTKHSGKCLSAVLQQSLYRVHADF